MNTMATAASRNPEILPHLEAFFLLGKRVLADPRGAYEDVARQLGIDVSALRRRIYLLEDGVGAGLFGGRGSALALTREGEEVLGLAGRILLDINDVRRRVGQRQSLLRVSDATDLEGLLARAIADHALKSTRISFRIQRQSAEEALVELSRGAVDIAIMPNKNKPLGLNAQSLGREVVALIVPQGHALETASVTAERLAGESLVLVRQAGRFCERVMRTLESVQPQNVMVQAESQAVAAAYVRAGVGLALVPRLGGDISIGEGAIGERAIGEGLSERDVTGLFAAVDYYAVWRRGRGLSTGELGFVECLMRAAGGRAGPTVRKRGKCFT